MAVTTIESIGSLSLTVVGCTTGATTVLTVSTTPSTVQVGQTILVASVGGVTGVNGSRVVTAVDTGAKTISFAGSSSGTYTSGGSVARTFATEASWNSAHNTEDLTAGAGRIYIGELCIDAASDYVRLFAAGTTYTVDFTGCTTSASCYRALRAWSGSRFNSIDRSGVKFKTPLDSLNRFLFRVAESHFRMEGFAVEITSLASHTSLTAPIEIANGAGVQVDSLFLIGRVGGYASSSFPGLYLSQAIHTGPGTNSSPSASSYCRVTNCVIRGADDTDVGFSQGVWSNQHFSTVYAGLVFGCKGGSSSTNTGAGHGFYMRYADQVVQNCISVGNRVAAYGRAAGISFPITAFGYNAADDSSASSVSSDGSGSENQVFDNILAAGTWRYAEFDDFRLLESSPLVESGLDLHAQFTADIAGVTRTVPWNIGPYEGFVGPDVDDPTEVVSYIGTGLDYATPDAFLAATALHLVARNERHRGRMRESFTLSSVLSVSGAVTDARRYRVLEADDGYRYDEVADTGVVLDSFQLNVVELAEEYVQLRGVRVENTSASTDRGAVRITAGHSVVDGVVGVVELATGNSRVFSNDGAEDVLIANCVAVGGNTAGTAGAAVGFYSDGARGLVANCDALRIRYGTSGTAFSDGGVPGTSFRNNIAGSSDIGFDVSDGYQDHNASIDATAAGPHSITGLVAAETWVDSGALDLRLLGTSAVVTAGAVLSTRFSTDITGAARSRPWAMGAHQGYLRPPQWRADRLKSTARLTRCMKLVRLDGLTLRFTDNIEAVLFDGMVFDPKGSMTASTTRQELSHKESSLEVFGAIDDDVISDADLEARLYDGATLYIYLVDLKFPWTVAIHTSVFQLLQVKRTRGKWTAQFVGLSASLDQEVGEVLTKECKAELGDERCGVDLSGYRHTAVEVDSVSASRRVFRATNASLGSTAPSGQAIVDDWFFKGYVDWISGDNIGVRCQVSHYVHATREIALYLETPYPIQVGDRFDLVAGCDKSSGRCKDVFDNLRRMRAQLFVPGTDRTLQTPTR